MKYIYKVLFLLCLVLLLHNNTKAQITGLSGWNITLDPGHSLWENIGIYNYAESHKNLWVARHLRELLLTTTDIDTVYMTRDDSTTSVSLEQRTTYANNIGTAWFHSIHSDAGSSTPNSTLLLWGQLPNLSEKIPNGGKAMSDIMIRLLTAGMRTNTVSGSIGDWSFYGCTTCSGPYLWVNRMTNMASELSEAGFHTNPKQNQLNMNFEWKRLEAKTFYWSILKKFGISRPYVGISTGIVSDLETGVPINSAVVTLNNRTYTTDSYQSLFYKFSNDSTLLHNGFYYFENIPAGTYTISVRAPGYDSTFTQITMQDTFFTFKDLQLVSKTLPKIASTSIIAGDSLWAGLNDLVINFTRGMDQASVASALSFVPSASPVLVWSNGDKTLSIQTANLAPKTAYQLKIAGTAKDKYNHSLDGNGSGIPGTDFTFNFRTRWPDTQPPQLVYLYPQANQDSLDQMPVIVINYDEQIKTTTLSGKLSLFKTSDNTAVTILAKVYLINGKSAINIFPRETLSLNENYTLKIAAGIEDMFSNAIAADVVAPFSVKLPANNIVSIESFESGIANWWSPSQSGSTVGIIPENTFNQSSSAYTNFITNSTKSMLLNYGWLLSAPEFLIRNYFIPTSPAFGKDVALESYVFGDGKGNKMRFCVTDQGPGGKEVSQWIIVDWVGWKLVSWDLKAGQTGTWIGNNILDTPLNFDSYQLTYTQGKPNIGTLYFDDLRVVNRSPAGVEDGKNNSTIPWTFTVYQNYPNPFNPATVISFGLPEAGNVSIDVFNTLGQKVSTLQNGYLSSGFHSVNFDATQLPSGIYFYTVKFGDKINTMKMTLLK